MLVENFVFGLDSNGGCRELSSLKNSVELLRHGVVRLSLEGKGVRSFIKGAMCLVPFRRRRPLVGGLGELVGTLSGTEDPLWKDERHVILSPEPDLPPHPQTLLKVH